MQIKPKFLPTQAIQLREELLASKGDWLLFDEFDNVLALTDQEFRSLYEKNTQKPTGKWSSPPPHVNGKATPARPITPGAKYAVPGRFNSRTAIGKTLLAFGQDGAGQFTTLTVSKISELLSIPKVSANTHQERLRRRGLIEVVKKLSSNENLYGVTPAGKDLIAKWLEEAKS